ncbi:MAG: hypothetical protein ACI4LX_03475 [Treponema sp.]
MGNKISKKKLFSVFIFALAFNLFSAENQNVLRKGNIFLEYIDLTSSVLVYYESSRGAKTPVIDIVDYGNSSFVGIAVDNRYYNLKTSGGVNYSFAIEDDSLTVTYEIGKKIMVGVVYTIQDDNVLSIKYVIKNFDSKDHAVSLKSIFDTILGEWKGGIYSTAIKPKINSEYIISDLLRHKFLTSTNGDIGISFVLNDELANDVYKIAIAAKPFFNSDVFEGRFMEGRSFNTVMSYNNSCVGFYFKACKIKASSQKSFVQKIKFISNDLLKFENTSSTEVSASESQKTEEAYYKQIIEQDEIPFAPEVIEETISEKQNVEEILSAEEKKSPEVKVPSSPKTEAEPERTPAVQTVQKTEQIKPESSSSQKKVDKEYARELIQKIQALNAEGKDVSKTEVLKLQLELEKVLNQLKAQQ